MEDPSGLSRALERARALHTDVARARDRAHQRSLTAGKMSERAATARRDAELADERARALRADQVHRTGFTSSLTAQDVLQTS
ncbi:hypothetical protein Aab01nite_58190 [Paractinoplanes abujensis]|nr:hypothetical protein Aab01nite_58190 [Actinoplanes abujensis]